MKVQTLHRREQKYSPPKEKKDRATALEKLFNIAGGADWDSQFQKKKKTMKEEKKVTSFICPEASVHPQVIAVTTCAQESYKQGLRNQCTCVTCAQPGALTKVKT